MKILPRTHNLGILNRAEIAQIAEQRSPLYPNMKAGDILVLHPLTVHSSNRSMDSNYRRIIHLEYTSGDLPPELAWY